jgi:hypothetical protein
MSSQESEHTARILPFEPRKPPKAAPVAQRSPLESLAKYARSDAEPDDYRHRQRTNAAAALVLIMLVVGGVWLAIKLAELRTNQDCLLAGRRNCAQVISTPSIHH